ncbi:collagenase, partial [Priestia megaterium]|uniref:collagenase n=1 Tax=Priestia megaterium TaxID=1404 RepID=UPI002FFEC9E5
YIRGNMYTKDNDMGIITLFEVLRSGFYLAFYNSELSQLNNRSVHDNCLPALKQIAKNPNFTLGTKVQSEIIQFYGLFINGASCDEEIVMLVSPIVKQFNDNLDIFINDYEAIQAIIGLIFGVEYDLDFYLWETGKSPNETIWYKKIDNFIKEVSKIALLVNLTKENTNLINNAIFRISTLGKFHSAPNKGCEILSQAMLLYPYLSEQYLTAAERIFTDYDGIDINGSSINFDEIREVAIKKYLPNTYTFEERAMVFKTGNLLTEDKIKRLYWAAKEVEAQFYRIIGSNKVLEKGNPDDVLTNIIYNSPEEYRLNSLLYGYDTNNGGIYIEPKGSLFTYERTSSQSVYSLEELFRHEFTHYLQGRYGIPGLWGQSEIYENQRLIWYEEGNAELLAGSTRTNSVVPRKSAIGGLAADPTQRYTLAQTIYANYETSQMYNYCSALQGFMYKKHLEILDKIQRSIKENKVLDYDKYRESLREDEVLNREYQIYMQFLIDNQEQYPIPEISNDYLLPHPKKALSETSQIIKSEFKLKNVLLTKHSSSLFNTFTLQGIYTGESFKGKYESWIEMDKELNQNLINLAKEEWSGYKTLTAYFKEFRVNTSNHFEYDVVIHGIDTE